MLERDKLKSSLKKTLKEKMISSNYTNRDDEIQKMLIEFLEPNHLHKSKYAGRVQNYNECTHNIMYFFIPL